MIINKKSAVIVSSLALISLTSCNKTTTSENVATESIDDNLQVSTRTIDPNEGVINLNKEKTPSLGSYDYTIGISSYPVIENIPLDESPENKEILEELFTLSEVEKIAENISNEYMNYLSENETYLTNEYEKYINSLENNYSNLETEYTNLLNDFLNYLDNNYQDETNKEEEIITDIPPAYPDDEPTFEDTSQEDENNNTDNKFLTREEEINAIYEKALYNSSKNINDYEPIQGQPQSTSKLILDKILENIELQPYTYANDSFISSNYGIDIIEIEDYKLIHSKETNSNYFELFIFKSKNLSDESLMNKLNLRISSILNLISEHTNNEFNIENNVLLLNIDDYTLFCFSKNSADILKLFEQ